MFLRAFCSVKYVAVIIITHNSFEWYIATPPFMFSRSSECRNSVE